MIVAGLGFRTSVSSEDVRRALALALQGAGLTISHVTALAVPASKADEGGFAALAKELELPILRLTMAQLEAQSPRVLTHSAHALARYGVPSVAETCALAGVVELGAAFSRLLAPRVTARGATCALARNEEAS